MRHALKVNMAKIWGKSKKIINPPGRESEQTCRILTYHSIHPHHPRGVRPSELEKQVKFLVDNNYKIITFEELLKMHQNPGCQQNEKLVILTFDDGYEDNFTYGFPILKDYDLPATIFLATRYIKKNNGFISKADGILYKNLEMLTWKQVEKMAAQKIEFGSHTHRHLDSGKIDRGLFEKEIVISKGLIEKYLQKPVNIFCYPLGRKHPEGEIILKNNGFKIACTTFWGSFRIGRDNPFEVRRCEIVHEDSIEDFNLKVKGDWDYMEHVHFLKGQVKKIAAVFC